MELGKRYDEIAAWDANVVAVSMDELSQAAKAVDRLNVQFPVLYDVEGKVVRSYGVYDLLDDELAAPSIFLVDKAANIRWQYVGNSVSDRPSTESVLFELQQIAER